MPATKAEAITLHGPPRKLTAVVRLETSNREALPITAQMPTGSVVFRGQIAPFGSDTSEIRVRLPRETPPGTYGGFAAVGGKKRVVVLDVEPVVRLRVHPKETRLSAGPGSRREFSVTVVNAGNAPLTIPKAATLDLEDDDRLDRALGKTLGAELGDGESRIDRYFEQMRSVYGGEARLTVSRGAGVLEPGQSCELATALDVPVTVQPGRTYTGGWEIGDAAHVIVIEATKGDPQPARRGRRKE